MPAEPVDVAIVGAGVAGLYCAYSLLERRAPVPGGEGPPRVVVLEAEERTGGRVRTQTPPDAPHLRAEVGGMRFYATQTLLQRLVDRLGLRAVPFHRGAMSDEHDLFYVRGRRFALADLRAGSDVVPYGLAADERGQMPGGLMRRALERAAPDFLERGPAERRALEPAPAVGDTPFSECSLLRLLSAALSDEAVALLRDAGGYREQLDPEVAASLLLQVTDSGGEQRSIEGGMQRLTDALAAAVQEGADIHTGTGVRAVEEAPGGGLRLAIERDGGAETIDARHVVLALPRRALQLMDRARGPLAAPAVEELIAGTVPVEAVKVYLGFAEPWWEALGIAAGKSVTDLPMHQCLYFGVEDEVAGGRPRDRHALMAGTYADAEDVGFWRERAAEGRPYAGRRGPIEGLEASEPLVAEVRRQVGEVHDIEVPEPEWALYVDWGVDPFGAGWHYWRTGTRFGELIPRARRPSPAHPLYVCGEAFSSRQGWILGALQTAERVLRDHLGQPAPDWLDPAADLGA